MVRPNLLRNHQQVFNCVIVVAAALPWVAMAGPLPDSALNLKLAAPIASWDEAIPLGNGLLGGLLWGE